MMKIVSKIAVTSINGVTKGFKKVLARSLAMRIVGIVQAFTPTENQTEFKGEFRAWNSKGEIFVAPKCVLPVGLQAAVLSAIQAAGKGKGVSVAADVYLTPDTTAAMGYSYEIVTLVTPQVYNPLDQLLQSIPAFVVPVPEPIPEPAGDTPQVDPTPETAPKKAGKK